MKLQTLISLASICLTGAVSAQTVYVVAPAPGPGVSFTSIQQAVDVATALDRVEIRAGNYLESVVVDGPITMMGERPSVAPPGARVKLQSLRVQNLPVGSVFVGADFEVSSFYLDACAGSVIIDAVEPTRRLSVSGCQDVRALLSGPFGGSVSTGIDVTASVVEFRATANSRSLSGASALDLNSGSAVTLVGCSFVGAAGTTGSCASFDPGGPGAPGIFVRDSTLRILDSFVVGGAGGFGCTLGTSGLRGAAVDCVGSTVITCNSFAGQSPLAPECPASHQDIPGLPRMRLDGDSAAGQPMTIEVLAEAGSNARLWMGRQPAVVPVPGLQVPRLHTFDRGSSLGAMPPSGLLAIPATVPNFPRGTLIFLQASRTLGSGATELSNSLPVVVR